MISPNGLLPVRGADGKIFPPAQEVLCLWRKNYAIMDKLAKLPSASW